MTRSAQTLESIRSDFDRIALLSEEGRDHNARYHKYLLRRLPERCGEALEIGCGTGEFSRQLSRRAGRVLAIDLAPQMIRIARERSKHCPNIEFIAGDVMAHRLPDNRFDCIATLTTLHHLPTEIILANIRAALKPGGVFVCLDLYRRSGAADLLFDCMAYPADLFLGLMNTGEQRYSRELREAYDRHGATDTYLTLSQIRKICADILPGALVRRHLFWRYSLVWRKPEDHIQRG